MRNQYVFTRNSKCRLAVESLTVESLAVESLAAVNNCITAPDPDGNGDDGSDGSSSNNDDNDDKEKEDYSTEDNAKMSRVTHDKQA